jgi:hypothetical protein
MIYDHFIRPLRVGFFFPLAWLTRSEEMKTSVFKDNCKFLLDATHHLPLTPDIPDA